MPSFQKDFIVEMNFPLSMLKPTFTALITYGLVSAEINDVSFCTIKIVVFLGSKAKVLKKKRKKIKLWYFEAQETYLFIIFVSSVKLSRILGT